MYNFRHNPPSLSPYHWWLCGHVWFYRHFLNPMLLYKLSSDNKSVIRKSLGRQSAFEVNKVQAEICYSNLCPDFLPLTLGNLKSCFGTQASLWKWLASQDVSWKFITKKVENRRDSSRLLVSMWPPSSSEQQNLLTLETVPSVTGRLGHILIKWLPGFYKQEVWNVSTWKHKCLSFQFSLLLLLELTHPCTHSVKALCILWEARRTRHSAIHRGKSATWFSYASITLRWWQKVSF